MRLTLLPILLLAPSLTLTLALPQPHPHAQVNSKPHSSSSLINRLTSVLSPRGVKPYRPLNGYEDEDTHNPPPPRKRERVAAIERRGFWSSFSGASGSGIKVNSDSVLEGDIDELAYEGRLPAGSGQSSDRGGRIAGNSYPKCKDGKKRRSGFAHYPGWKLIGDDLSGPLPVNPRANCVNVCNKYGSACSGVYYDDNTARCHLKGTKTAAWTFSETDYDDDGTDLLGGCAVWHGIVPKEMDEVCCRD
ncbi:hypothetical protein CI109_105474 [Kwoniella shandongensis]|uniref:Uncharacterized protein n=1 Tax=Kwoniella shandongensis TaxID=1734106 RepID=A0A5M6C698_9TREE|nr:uncharacterized protein CI109_002195 [Kwoniella shandongensis]KAA5529302.1 hypothetical protein CI109_002195 [Kwoniella shandongensis]